MNEEATNSPLHRPGSTPDPLAEIAREPARQMRMAALKAEAARLIARFCEELLAEGRLRVVRHGTGPERVIRTGIGPVPMPRQKMRDRAMEGTPGKRIRSGTYILPRRARYWRGLDALLPVLPLRGASNGVRAFLRADDVHALTPGGADNLARGGCAEPVAGAVSRRTAGWQDDHDRWRHRDPSARRLIHVLVWVDGVYLQARMTQATRRSITFDRGIELSGSIVHTELDLHAGRAVEEMLNASIPVNPIAAEIGRHCSVFHREVNCNSVVDDNCRS